MTPSIVRSSGAPLGLPGLLNLSPAPARLRASTTQTEGFLSMRYLHTMLRVRDLDAALKFFCDQLGLVEMRRRPDERDVTPTCFLRAAGPGPGRDQSRRRPRRAAPRDHLQLGRRGLRRSALFRPPCLRGRRHLCDLRPADESRRQHQRPPRDGVMAFVRSPDKQSVELLQKGAALPAQEPWKSMPNTGKW